MEYGGIYRTGTISIAADATAVTGSGSLWGAHIEQGDFLIAGGVASVVDSIDTDIGITLSAPWPGPTLTGAAYQIVKTSWLRNSTALTQKKVRELLAAQAVSGFYWFVGPTATAPDPADGDDGQYARQPSSGKEWLKQAGVWVYQGISGNLSVSSAPWSSGTTYAMNVIAPFAGRLWLSRQGNNIGHQPDVSPTWWQEFLAGGDTVYIAMDDSDRPASGETVLKFISPKAMTIFASMADSYAKAGVGATATAVYSVRKNGTEFATITFAAGGQAGAQSGMFACAASVGFAPGDILSIVAPNPRDATLSGIGITVTGYR